VGTASPRGLKRLGDSVCNYNTGTQRCTFTWMLTTYEFLTAMPGNINTEFTIALNRLHIQNA